MKEESPVGGLDLAALQQLISALNRIALGPAQSAIGVSNGTNAVEMVAAPPTNVRRVVTSIYISNPDTVASVFAVRVNDGATPRVLARQSLAADTYVNLTGEVVLDSTSKSLDMLLEAAHTTTAPEWVVTWRDE